MKKIDSGWLAAAWRRQDADAKTISFQKRLLCLFFLLCLVLSIGWMTAPSRLTVYLPPDIQNGATLKPSAIPPALIYSFAYEVFQEIQYWSVNGEVDYPKNIQTYAPYLTPDFKADLLREEAELLTAGQLQRTRYLQGISGTAYDTQNVKSLSRDAWEVDLIMRLTEYKNNQPVKDITMRYPVKVIRSNVSPRHNPYGLVLAGFVAPPERLATVI